MFIPENSGDATPPATEPEKRISSTDTALKAATLSAIAIREPSGNPTKVKIVAPYQCCHAGETYLGGDVATVPSEIAHHWIGNHWAAPVRAAKAARAHVAPTDTRSGGRKEKTKDTLGAVPEA